MTIEYLEALFETRSTPLIPEDCPKIDLVERLLEIRRSEGFGSDCNSNRSVEVVTILILVELY